MLCGDPALALTHPLPSADAWSGIRVAVFRDPSPLEEHPYSASGLRVRWLDGELRSPCLNAGVGRDFGGTWFEPARAPDHVELVFSQSPLGVDECLRRLQALNEPVTSRTHHQDPVSKQWRFVAGPGRWLVTYHWYEYVKDGVAAGVGQRLSVAFPASDDDAVRNSVLAASADLNCDVRWVAWR